MVFDVDAVMRAIKTESCLSEIDDVIHAFNPDGDSIDKVVYILEKALHKAQGIPYTKTWKVPEPDQLIYNTIMSLDPQPLIACATPCAEPHQ